MTRNWAAYLLVAGLILLGVFAYFSKPHESPEWGEVWALDEIGDPTFKEYMLTVLWPRCPFYEPSGAIYRDCLWKVVEENTATYKKEKPTPEDIENQCRVIGNKFEGLLAGEMTLACRAFKLI